MTSPKRNNARTMLHETRAGDRSKSATASWLGTFDERRGKVGTIKIRGRVIDQLSDKGVATLLSKITGKIQKRKVNLCNLKHFRGSAQGGGDKVEEEKISFQTPRVTWQREKAAQLGLVISEVTGKPAAKKMISVMTPPRVLEKIIGDGNCFFRALSWIVTGTQDHHQFFRGRICDQIDKEHVEKADMRKDGTFAEVEEILGAAELLQTTIMVYTMYNAQVMRWIPNPRVCQRTARWPCLYLDHSRGNHFDVVLAC